MTKPWRVAESLDVLLGQINAMFPGRSKAWDGGIGDEAHQTRDSDHNAWIKDGGYNVVSARDFTNDPAHGLDSQKLAEALVASRDERIKYIISNKKICSGTGQDHQAWQWRPYTGASPHDHHCHVSVKSDKKHYDSTAQWVVDMRPGVGKDLAEEVKSTIPPTVKMGSKDAETIKKLQAILGVKVDGIFGVETKKAVETFQAKTDQHLVDGIVGPHTWTALLTKKEK
jgi:hypothetical protein